MDEKKLRAQIKSLLAIAKNPKHLDHLKALDQLKQIAEAAKDPKNKEAQAVAQIIAEEMKGVKALYGAKLNYLAYLKGECPEGEEVVYFQKGGKTCKACEGKKLEKGSKLNPVEDFKNKRKKKALQLQK